MKTTAILISCASLTAITAPLDADDPAEKKVEAVHSVMRENVGEPEECVGEIWIKGDKQRWERPSRGAKEVCLLLGDKVFRYRLGEKIGEKRELQEPDLYGLSPLQEVARVQKEGQKIGVEEAEGVACEKYELTDGILRETMWVSQKTQLPVKSIEEFHFSDHVSKHTTLYTRIELNLDVADSLFELPEDVQFVEEKQEQRQP